MKIISILVAGFLCLLAGCAARQPARMPKAVVPEATISRDDQKSAVSDDFKIEAAVYGYLLEKHPWADGGYAAIFIDGTDALLRALQDKFPHQVPPLKANDRAGQRPNLAPVDKDTGKPGLLLSAKPVDPTNGVSEAIGTWYGGETVSGVYAFVLVEMGGEWTIQSVK